MAQLTANKPRVFELNTVDYENDLPVAAANKIFDGSAVSDAKVSTVNTGAFNQLVAGEDFGGFAIYAADNSGGAAGAVRVKVKERGNVVLSVTGVTGIADRGKTVYGIDGNTFTLTAGSNSPIGKIRRWISGTQVLVYFESTAVRSL